MKFHHSLKKILLFIGVLVLSYAAILADPPDYEALMAQIKAAMSDNLKSETIRKGADLQYMAQTYYGDSRGWPLVWFFNSDTISNPELVSAGTKIKIPRLRAGIDQAEAAKALENAYLLVYKLYLSDGKHSRSQSQWVLGQATESGIDVKSSQWLEVINNEDLEWINIQKPKTQLKSTAIPKTVTLNVQLMTSAIEAAASADEKSLENLVAKAQKNNTLKDLQGDLEIEASKPESDARPEVHFALAITYGRLGLKGKEYQSLLRAEEAAKKPGVNFNITLVYGRKQLLENDTDADTFLIGDLDITTDPLGAKVFVDGLEKGIGPLVVKGIKIGKHKLVLSYEDHVDTEKETEIKFRETTKENLQLAPKEARIKVNGVSLTSVVRVDGAPYDLADPQALKWGRHTIIVNDINIEDYEGEFTIESNDLKILSPKLSYKSLNWEIACNVGDAEFSIDGKPFGRVGKKKYPIQSGYHTLSVSRIGYETFSQKTEFLAENGQTSPFLVVTLLTLPRKVTTTNKIKIDGAAGDWFSIEPYNSSEYPKKDLQRQPGNFIKELKLAQDSDYVYVYFSTVDGGLGDYFKSTSDRGIVGITVRSVNPEHSFSKSIFVTIDKVYTALTGPQGNMMMSPELDQTFKIETENVWDSNLSTKGNVTELRVPRPIFLEGMEEGTSCAVILYFGNKDFVIVDANIAKINRLAF